MHFPLSLFLVAVTGVTVIALPVSKTGLDPQAAVEGKLEVREPQLGGLVDTVDGVVDTVGGLVDGVVDTAGGLLGGLTGGLTGNLGGGIGV